jgi:phosphatidate cytidylyltransferase
MELPKLSIPNVNFSVISISPELRKRVLSAGLLIPAVLTIVWLGGSYYDALVLIAAIIMSFEWNTVINTPKEEPLSDRQKKSWAAVGIVYVMLFSLPLLYLRDLESGFGIILLLLLLIWATDIAAYFTGKTIGGPKIWPKISPKKTWAGLAGGMVAAGMVLAITSTILTGYSIVGMFLLGMVLAVMAQVGDFFESWVKRYFGVKDSGSIIPGHGGIMDRMDGFVTVAPIVAVIAMLNDGVVF